MYIYKDDQLVLYFGDACNNFEGDFLAHSSSKQESDAHSRLRSLHEFLEVDQLFFLKQTHSDRGITVTQENPFVEPQEGDFLITNQKHRGLGVYTADCLPVILYDPLNSTVGICHAGWVGSVKGVTLKALEQMVKEYDTAPDQVRVFFGPSPQVCCYEVQHSFLLKLEPFSFKKQVISERAGKLYFDLPLFNRLLLEKRGVNPHSFITSYNVCTICTESYCSSRRSKGSIERQVSVVVLR